MNRHIVIMGVSGSGKTSLGKALAQRLDCDFIDADDFHPQTNKDKMQAGQPLNDEDRAPWLAALAQHLGEQSKRVVLACSALKQTYRDQMEANGSLQWVYLEGSFDLIQQRLQQRSDHFFDPALLQSQFDTLEVPQDAITLNVAAPLEELVNQLIKQLDASLSEFGILGLGVMGSQLAKNAVSKGITLSVFNRAEGSEARIVSNFLDEVNTVQVKGFTDLALFVASLRQPRKIFMMVPAGSAVDAVISSLTPLLDPGDILMDGGNSHYEKTKERGDLLAQKEINYLGVGVSGGAQGALLGPSMMIGGPEAAYTAVHSFLEALAAKDSSGLPCAAHLGPDGAGHFVKMIHNGIEYAEMQLIAECYSLLAPRSNEEIADIFESWNQTDLSGFLLDATVKILRKKEADQHLVDLILDKAASKGTGSWSVQAAAQLGVPASMINAAVTARFISMIDRSAAPKPNTNRESIDAELVRQAYSFGRLVNHHQGFEILKAASATFNWNLNLALIARIWTEGCIIKSQWMEQFAQTLTQQPTILEDTTWKQRLEGDQSGAKEVLKYALNQSISLECISNSYNYILGIKSKRSASNIIQAQRDFFGSHTYKRIDQPETDSFTTNWT